MHSGAPAAAEVVESYRERLERIRTRHPELVAQLRRRLARCHYARSHAYTQFSSELARSLGADAACACDQVSEQYLAMGECRSQVSALLSRDSVLFAAAIIEAHGVRGCRAEIEDIVAQSPAITLSLVR